MLWKFLSAQSPENVDQLEELLLLNRSITPAEKSAFFAPIHPLDLTLEEVEIDSAQMRKTVERLMLAKAHGEEVVVFGDYDADGVCATAVLWETLHELGIKARPFIPHREKHGYGMTDRSLNDVLKEKKPSLLVSVDTGIVALKAVERLNAEGVEVIITDHHVPEVSGDAPVFPEAFSIVHTTKLCGTTVAWMLARELKKEKAAQLLDLCGIATIADQMVLQGANRSFAYHGVEALKTTTRVGILNLCRIAKVEQPTISSYTINYQLAPRINAMGRIASAMDALRALCTKNAETSFELMQVLQTTNQERQEMTTEMVEEAVENSQIWENQHIVIVASSAYHEGVIGLIAGKLVDRFAKPAIAISVGEKSAKASARSVAGVNVVELIRQVRDDLLEVGGHPMAAGFSVLPEKIEVVKQRLQDLAKAQVSSELLVKSLTVECELPLSLALSFELLEMLKKFEPFGNGNTQPVFALKGLQLAQVQAVGRDKRHLKLVARGVVESAQFRPTTQSLEGIGFGLGHLAAELRPGQMVDLAGTLGVNEWNGKRTVQIVVRDVLFGE